MAPVFQRKMRGGSWKAKQARSVCPGRFYQGKIFAYKEIWRRNPNFGHGHLEEKDGSFPQEGKHRAPVLQGQMSSSPRHAKVSQTCQVAPKRPNQTCSVFPWFRVTPQCHNVLLASEVSQWPSASVTLCNVTMGSWFLKCHHGPSAPCGPALSQRLLCDALGSTMSPWPLSSMQSLCVTMASL